MALGGPAAGQLTTLAVRVLTSALGLPPDTPPHVVAQAVQDATPDQQTAIRQADDTFRAHAMDLAAQSMAGQVAINQVEAGSSSMFLAGWRPMVGWVCAAGLGWGLVLEPIILGLARLRWPLAMMLPVDLPTLITLTLAMLGVGTMRTVEKLNNVSTKRIRRAPPVAASLPAVVLAIPQPAPEPIPPVVIRPPTSDRKPFYDIVRPLFGGHMTASQVSGMERILNHARTITLPDPRHLAYILATTLWETGRVMMPIEEVGHGAGHPYGATQFWGRGLVQLTNEDNYRRMGAHIGIDLVAHPERMLEWDVSLVVLFEGMGLGMFTGAKLADSFNATTDDPRGARRIVNGTDHAVEVAGAHALFLQGLEAIQ